MAEALDETRQIIGSDSESISCEAAFEHEGMRVRADVIERPPGGGWRLVEVKSKIKPREVFVLDVVAQLQVLQGAELNVREAGVLTDNTASASGRRSRTAITNAPAGISTARTVSFGAGSTMHPPCRGHPPSPKESAHSARALSTRTRRSL